MHTPILVFLVDGTGCVDTFEIVENTQGFGATLANDVTGAAACETRCLATVRVFTFSLRVAKEQLVKRLTSTDDMLQVNPLKTARSSIRADHDLGSMRPLVGLPLLVNPHCWPRCYPPGNITPPTGRSPPGEMSILHLSVTPLRLVNPHLFDLPIDHGCQTPHSARRQR